MTISKRMLLPLVALLMAGVAFAMYLGLQMGRDMSAAPAPIVTVEPAAASHEAACDPAEIAAAVAAHHDDPRDETHGGGDGAEIGDFATNSGTVSDAQFVDGGFGDIGQQWWNVTVNGHVTTVNVTENGTANVAVGDEIINVEAIVGVDLGLGEPDTVSATTTTTAPPASTTTTTVPPSTTSTTVPAP